MAMAIGNPDDIDAIAGALENYLDAIESETDRLSAAFAQYGESWQDQQRQDFEERYQALLAIQAQFRDEASQQLPHLQGMAETLREYLSR